MDDGDDYYCVSLRATLKGMGVGAKFNRRQEEIPKRPSAGIEIKRRSGDPTVDGTSRRR